MKHLNIETLLTKYEKDLERAKRKLEVTEAAFKVLEGLEGKQINKRIQDLVSAALPEGAKCYYHNDTRFNKKYIDLYIYNDERYPIGITIARDEERKYDNEIIFKKYNPWRGNFGIEEAEKRIHLLRTQPTLIEEWNKHIDRMEEIRMLFDDRSSFEFKEY